MIGAYFFESPVFRIIQRTLTNTFTEKINFYYKGGNKVKILK